MSALFRNRISVVWLLLVVATLFSWETAHVDGKVSDHRYSTMAVMIIAFTKVRFIGLEFMELRHAPLPLRIALEAWVVLVCAAILTVYWQGLP